MRGKFHLLETSGLHSECARTDEKLLCHNNSRTTKGSKTRVGGVGGGGWKGGLFVAWQSAVSFCNNLCHPRQQVQVDFGCHLRVTLLVLLFFYL